MTKREINSFCTRCGKPMKIRQSFWESFQEWIGILVVYLYCEDCSKTVQGLPAPFLTE